MSWTIRPARPDDVGGIHALVHELAVYEREPDAVDATPQDLADALFGTDPLVHCHVVEAATEDGASDLVGVAIWYVAFSTWRGRHGIWLEDLFVRPSGRGLGIGRALLQALAAECTARGYARLEWAVLDWNEPAHEFYRSLDAVPQDDWTVWRLDGEALDLLGHPRADIDDVAQ